LKIEAVKATIDGMKQAGINPVVWLPSQGFASLIDAITRDSYFTHIPVSHEGNGIGLCAGAWLGGKKPALVIQNSGFILMTYALMGLLRLGGFPTLMLIDQRGIIGDKKGHWLFGWGRTTPQILDMLEIPYSVVQGDFNASLVRCQETTEAYGKPVAMLFSGEDVYGN
jgi:sulfopyruvate decarboxylase subunit alpha